MMEVTAEYRGKVRACLGDYEMVDVEEFSDSCERALTVALLWCGCGRSKTSTGNTHPRNNGSKFVATEKSYRLRWISSVGRGNR